MMPTYEYSGFLHHEKPEATLKPPIDPPSGRVDLQGLTEEHVQRDARYGLIQANSAHDRKTFQNRDETDHIVNFDLRTRSG